MLALTFSHLTYTSLAKTSVLAARHRRYSVRTVNKPTTIVTAKSNIRTSHMPSPVFSRSSLSFGLFASRTKTPTVQVKHTMMTTISHT